MPKIHLATSRDIGLRCHAWAEANLPGGVELSSMDECDIFISVLYDKLIPQEFLQSRRCYNFHPGYLPEYRGSGAYSWVIINNESTAGVTLHLIDKDIDHGAIIAQRIFPVLDTDTAQTLFNQAEDIILEMFKMWFVRLATGKIDDIRPNLGGHVYLRKDLDKAKDLTRFVRALTFEGKESAYFINKTGRKIYLNYGGDYDVS